MSTIGFQLLWTQPCRSLWEAAVTLSKTVLTQQKAEEAAASVLESIRKLIDILKSEGPKPDQDFHVLVNAAKDLVDIQAALTQSEDKKALEAVNLEVSEIMKDFGVAAMKEFGTWLDRQWLPPSDDAAEQTLEVCEKEVLDSLTPSLQIRGLNRALLFYLFYDSDCLKLMTHDFFFYFYLTCDLYL